MASVLTRAAVINRSVCQVLLSCLADKWDQFFLAVPGEEVQDVPLGCRITREGVMWSCVWGFSGAIKVLPVCSKATAAHPATGLVCSLFLHKFLKCEWWLIPTASLLPLVSPIASSGQCWCDDQQGFLLTLLVFHCPITLSLTETDHFLFPSGTCLFGLQLEDHFRVSTLAPSLTSLYLDIKILPLSPFLLVSLLCAELYFLVSTLMIPRKSITIYYCVALKVSCENRCTTVFTET